MITKQFLSVLTLWSLSSSAIFAAALVFNIDSGSRQLFDIGGALLTGGSDTVSGDGAVVQLGYFSQATSDGNNFVGNWVPITGQGSANFVNGSPFDTTVGDDAALIGGGGPGTADGLFVIADFIIQDTAQNLPQVDTILSIRVFDKTAIAAAGAKYMTISNNLWKWKAPGDPRSPGSIVNMSFDQTSNQGLRSEDRFANGGTASTPNGADASSVSPRPTIPVPEPSSLLLLSIGALVSMKRRRS